jgi:hypothetical protein
VRSQQSEYCGYSINTAITAGLLPVSSRSVGMTQHITTDASRIASQLDSGRIRTAILICVLMLVLYGALLIGSSLLIGRDAVVCFHIVYFRGAVGVPASIISSVSVVALLAASTGGEFKIHLWGLSLEGPSAPITMWVVCFLSTSLSLYMLFPGVDSIAKLPPVLAKLCAAN